MLEPNGDSRTETEFQLKSFYLAKYLLTHQQFQSFIDHPNGFNNPDWWADTPEIYQQQDLLEPSQPHENYPYDSLSLYQALAFCRWLSAQLGYEIRLPMEWEWQWAAQSGLEKRPFPWGVWDERCCNTSQSGIGRSTAVGMYPQGAAACGALDMIGNVWEWCLDGTLTMPESEQKASANGHVLQTVARVQRVFKLPSRESLRFRLVGLRLCRPDTDESSRE